MIETFEAVTILAFAVFPGATFVWALERAVGKWEFGLSDRLLRFVVYSALIHAPFFPLTAWLVDAYLVDPRPTDPSWFLLVWAWALVYAFGPAVLGHVVGSAVRNREAWAELFTGRDPAPQAWDHLFLIVDEPGWVRLKLKTGTWNRRRVDTRRPTGASLVRGWLPASRGPLPGRDRGGRPRRWIVPPGR